MHKSYKFITLNGIITGVDPGFQVRGGAHLKKLRRAVGGPKSFGECRVKNHDFTQKHHIFSNFRGEGGGGGGRRVRLPLDPPLNDIKYCSYLLNIKFRI
jgi:hypothetical protein